MIALMLGLHRRLVHDQTRTYLTDGLELHQTIGAQGVAGIDQIDNAISETHQWRQFHRTIELDDLGLHAEARIVFACNLRVFGRDPRAAIDQARLRRPGHRQTATRNLEIQRLVVVTALVFHQHVLAGNAEVGRAVFDISRHVGGADHQQAYTRLRGVQHQLAGSIRVIGRRNADACQQRHRLLENTAFGDREHDLVRIGIECIAHVRSELSWARAHTMRRDLSSARV